MKRSVLPAIAGLLGLCFIMLMLGFALATLMHARPGSALSEGSPTPEWDYDPARVRAAITRELTDALCPPYSTLTFTEDGTYACHAG